MLLKQMQKNLHDILDRIDEILLHTDSAVSSQAVNTKLRLSMMPAYFKGTKPVAVIYPDGREITASTWKQTVTEILRECASDERMRSRLQEISGKVFGRNRTILGRSAEGMDVPVEIAEGVFLKANLTRKVC